MSKYNCWNPGIETEIPPQYDLYETIYNRDVVDTTRGFVKEAQQLTGIDPQNLVVFNAKRLALHELLIRVTADLTISEGSGESDFDDGYQKIVKHIRQHYIDSDWTEINGEYFEVVAKIKRRVASIIVEMLEDNNEKPVTKSSLLSWFNIGKEKPKVSSLEDREYRILANCKKQGLSCIDPLDSEVYKSIYLILGAIKNHRGFLGRKIALLNQLVTNYVINNYGSRKMGEIISPYIDLAAKENAYIQVKDHRAPVLISLKGPSAAGKSYLRSMLQEKISDFGIRPESNATISPDVWRRLLLDFESLGPAYKYAGPFTGVEVALIDRKLDKYIRDKSQSHHAIPHLLVDRFRFDSFASENVAKILHATYAQYINTMHMYFLVTPPEAIVERGWLRGLSQGRYKAVEDLLAHSVEAYRGMPKLLFKWLAYQSPKFKFYFMDNSVAKGQYPKTIAYGTQGEINIVDIHRFIDIEKFKKINIKAKTPEELYLYEPIIKTEENLDFFRQCVHKIDMVNMIDDQSQKIYASYHGTVLKVLDQELFELKKKEEIYRAVFSIDR